MSAESPFVIVPRGTARPRSRWPLIALLWALSLVAVGWGVQEWRAREGAQAGETPEQLRETISSLQARLDDLRQRNLVLKRSDDISSEANQQQAVIACDHELSLAALPALGIDVGDVVDVKLLCCVACVSSAADTSSA